jgi:hypothetical protein
MDQWAVGSTLLRLLEYRIFYNVVRKHTQIWCQMYTFPQRVCVYPSASQTFSKFWINWQIFFLLMSCTQTLLYLCKFNSLLALIMTWTTCKNVENALKCCVIRALGFMDLLLKLCYIKHKITPRNVKSDMLLGYKDIWMPTSNIISCFS